MDILCRFFYSYSYYCCEFDFCKETLMNTMKKFMTNRIFQGGCFPAMNTLLATWFPPAERSKYTTLVMTGKK